MRNIALLVLRACVGVLICMGILLTDWWWHK